MKSSWLSGVAVCAVAVLAVGCTNGEDSSPLKKDVGATDAAGGSTVSPTAGCLRERGWEVVAEEDGFSSPQGLPASQLDAYSADVADCLSLMASPTPPEAVSDERWAEFYSDVVDTAKCLRDQGIDVPDTPSLQAVRDSYLTPDKGTPYTPWNFVPVPSMDRTEFEALEEACPQVLL